MNRKLLAIVLLAAAPAWLHAQRPGFLSEDLAVEIEADAAELSDQRNVSIYRGNVKLTRGPLTMLGDVLKIERDPDNGRIRATLSGAPAQALHQTTAEAEPVIATAKEIVYTTQIEVLEMNGSARIKRGGDELSGDSVRYDVANERIEADGGQDRVRILLTPPEPTP